MCTRAADGKRVVVNIAYVSKLATIVGDCARLLTQQAKDHESPQSWDKPPCCCKHFGVN